MKELDPPPLPELKKLQLLEVLVPHLPPLQKPQLELSVKNQEVKQKLNNLQLPQLLKPLLQELLEMKEEKLKLKL